MIEVEGLTKHYGKLAALSDVSFRVARHSVVGFLGPNGAGKSTTLKILAGFIGPTAGRARVAGFDVQNASLSARRCIGYMPESAPMYPEMRVREYLAFRAELKGVSSRKRTLAVERALALAVVDEVADMLILQLSKGFRQRVALADALVADPPLLVLDEPTAGLDPNQIRQVRQLIRDLGTDHTVFLSTHILSEVEATCSRAIVVHRGVKVAEGSLDELRAAREPGGLTLGLRGTSALARSTIEGLHDVSAVEVESTASELELRVYWRRDCDTSEATERLFSALSAAGVGIRRVVPLVASLEEVFASLTRDTDPRSETRP